MAHSYIELDKAVVHVIRWVSFLWLWFVCLPSDALSQRVPSYLGFSHPGRGVAPLGRSFTIAAVMATVKDR